jgi:hypothetical protein
MCLASPALPGAIDVADQAAAQSDLASLVREHRLLGRKAVHDRYRICGSAVRTDSVLSCDHDRRVGRGCDGYSRVIRGGRLVRRIAVPKFLGHQVSFGRAEAGVDP